MATKNGVGSLHRGTCIEVDEFTKLIKIVIEESKKKAKNIADFVLAILPCLNSGHVKYCMFNHPD